MDPIEAIMQHYLSDTPEQCNGCGKIERGNVKLQEWKWYKLCDECRKDERKVMMVVKNTPQYKINKLINFHKQ